MLLNSTIYYLLEVRSICEHLAWQKISTIHTYLYTIYDIGDEKKPIYVP